MFFFFVLLGLLLKKVVLSLFGYFCVFVVVSEPFELPFAPFGLFQLVSGVFFCFCVRSLGWEGGEASEVLCKGLLLLYFCGCVR